MRLFVDTEFTDFIDCDLVSVALVADDGREFYGERSDYDRASCNEFVRAAVLSQLGQYPGRVFTREALRAALVAWLDQFADEPERVLCFDYGGDWELLCDLLDGPPAGWQAHHVGQLLDPGRMEDYYREHRGRHHALVERGRSGTQWGKPMLRVTVELLPNGDAEAARQLARLDVGNDDAAGTLWNGHYDLALTYFERDGSIFTRTARLEDFYRERSAMDLVQFALATVHPVRCSMTIGVTGTVDNDAGR